MSKVRLSSGVHLSALLPRSLASPAEFLREAAAVKLDLPVLGGDAIASPALTELLQDKPELLKSVTATAFHQGTDAFKKRFAEFALGVEYDGNAAQAYDAMQALLRAYAAAPAPKDSPSLARLIPKQNFTGLLLRGCVFQGVLNPEP
jgi:ABC-type branched-subunit amino acid transport system substrate-binding protein